jgi:DNA-binding PadR family transcriptional regulator
VVKRPPQSRQMRRRRITELSSAGRESLTDVLSDWQ